MSLLSHPDSPIESTTCLIQIKNYCSPKLVEPDQNRGIIDLTRKEKIEFLYFKIFLKRKLKSDNLTTLSESISTLNSTLPSSVVERFFKLKLSLTFFLYLGHGRHLSQPTPSLLSLYRYPLLFSWQVAVASILNPKSKGQASFCTSTDMKLMVKI